MEQSGEATDLVPDVIGHIGGESGGTENSSVQSLDKLLNGKPAISNALPLFKCYSYSSSLSTLIPDKIKSQIWDRKYVEMKQLYQIQIRGEVKQDFAFNISNQGPSSLSNVSQINCKAIISLFINGYLRFIVIWMSIYKSSRMKHQVYLRMPVWFMIWNGLVERKPLISMIDLSDRISRLRICPGVRCTPSCGIKLS